MIRNKWALKKDERQEFTATFVEVGWQGGHGDFSSPTLILKDVMQGDDMIAESLWCSWTKEFEALPLKKGDRIRFNAKIVPYLKNVKTETGYVKEKAYKLHHPRKFSLITEDKEEAE